MPRRQQEKKSKLSILTKKNNCASMISTKRWNITMPSPMKHLDCFISWLKIQKRRSVINPRNVSGSIKSQEIKKINTHSRAIKKSGIEEQWTNYLRIHIKGTKTARNVNTSMQRYVQNIFWPIELSTNLHLSPRILCHYIPRRNINKIMFLSVWPSWILVHQHRYFPIHMLRNVYGN